MTEKRRVFLLDANVLIAAHRSYYAFDLCPGFWASIKSGFNSGKIFSTVRVRTEIEKGVDNLSKWIADDLPRDFFLDDSTANIVAAYRPMMAWVAGKDFQASAKAKFATDADGWLVATAKEAGFCLVTHETRQDGARGRVPMPNVCAAFNVNYCTTFEMLRKLGCNYK